MSERERERGSGEKKNIIAVGMERYYGVA